MDRGLVLGKVWLNLQKTQMQQKRTIKLLTKRGKVKKKKKRLCKVFGVILLGEQEVYNRVENDSEVNSFHFL